VHVEPFNRKQEALGGELALRVCRGRRAGIVLSGEAASGRTVDQAGSDLPGRSGDEDFHVWNITAGARRGLEKMTTWPKLKRPS
jgi:hypothetical protein